MTEPRPEPEGGQQDPDRPDLLLLLHALRDHLRDVGDEDALPDEVRLRNGALRRALIRYLIFGEPPKTVDGRDPVPPGAVD